MDKRFKMSLLAGVVVIAAAVAGAMSTGPSWLLVLACLGMALMGMGLVQKTQSAEGTAAAAIDRVGAWTILAGGVLSALWLLVTLLFGG